MIYFIYSTIRMRYLELIAELRSLKNQTVENHHVLPFSLG